MYVTLEPCCHYGRTPPCTKALIDAGITEVNVAMLDPNPLVAGNGVEVLRQAGIKVSVGSLEEDARGVNEAYVKYITTRMPLVTAKFAMSLDGKIATKTGDSKWVSNEEARRYVHRLRRLVDAVMVGAGTVVRDNPRLTVRSGGGRSVRNGRQPIRIVIDGRGRIPASARIFDKPGSAIVFTGHSASETQKGRLLRAGAEIIEAPEQTKLIDMSFVLSELGRRDISHVLVEGGGQLLGHLFDIRLVDRVVVFISPIIIGGDKATTPVSGAGVDTVAAALRLRSVKYETIGDNLLVSGHVDRG